MSEIGEQLRSYVDARSQVLTADEIIDAHAPVSSPVATTAIPASVKHRKHRVLVTLGAAVVAVAVVSAALLVHRSDEGTPTRAPRRGFDRATWRTTSTPPSNARDRFFGLGDIPRATALGHDLYVYGTQDMGAQSQMRIWRFNPRTAMWSTLPPAPVAQRGDTVVVATKEGLLVWGGSTGGTLSATGALYSPDSDTWAAIPDAPFAGDATMAVVSTGHTLLVWGNDGAGGSQGESFDLRSATWHTIAAAPIPPRIFPAAVWTGSEMLVWGGCSADASSIPGPCDAYSGAERTDGARYNPTTNTWVALPKGPLGPRTAPLAVWTGEEMIIWGSDAGDQHAHQGAAFNPVDNTWHAIAPSPLGRTVDAQIVWDGTDALVLGGQNIGTFGYRAPFGAAYNPKSNTWAAIPAPPDQTAKPAAYGATNGTLTAIGGANADWHVATIPTPKGRR